MSALRKLRRLLRFTLRGVLLAISILCVWLGWLANSAKNQKAACERLRSFGGMPWDYEFPIGVLPLWECVGRGPEWLTAFLDIDLVANVTNVRFSSSTEVDGAVVAELRALPRLEAIEFVETHVEPTLIASLRELPKLQSLTLKGMTITDQMIAAISQLRAIERLSLEGSRVAEANLSALPALQSLSQLDLNDACLSWRAIWRLEQLLPQCWITPSTLDRKYDLVFSRMNDAAVTAASGLAAIDRCDWPRDFLEQLALQVSDVDIDGLLHVQEQSKCRIGNSPRIERAWRKSFQGTVHISHVRLNDRGGPWVDLHDFMELQGTICEIRPEEFD